MSGSYRASVGKKTGVRAGPGAAGAGPATLRRALMLGLLIASLAASERAQADCAPPANNNVTATCTGTTTNQNPPNGFGTGNETNLNTTVVQGATVTGTAGANANGVGIFFSTGSVANFGAISGTGGNQGIGIGANNNAIVTSSGTISGTAGNNASGIDVNNNATVTNSGTISGTGTNGNGNGIVAGVNATVISSGTILATGVNGNGNGIFSFGDATVTSSGTILATGMNGNGSGIQTLGNATVTNSGSISGTGKNGDGSGIQANTATITSSGTISGMGTTAGANGFGIAVGDNATVTSSGTISGTGGNIGRGIFAASATVTSSGTISGTGGNQGFGIDVTSATVTNSGTISGNGGNQGFGISAIGNVTVTNSGTISGIAGTTDGEGFGISAVGNVTVTNSGTISGIAGGAASGIDATNATVINSGTISATAGNEAVGIVAVRNANVTNSGSISGAAGAGTGVGVGIEANGNATVTNSGTISATGGRSFGIQAFNSATVTNSGTISGTGGAGGIGIFVGTTGNVANSGTIIGTGGTAIQFNGNGTPASDILTVLPGARFGGLVNFGHGADTVNFGPGSWILNTAKFDAGLSSVNTAGNPFVVTPNQIIVADLSGFGAQNRAILDITGWIGSVLPDTPVFAPGAGGGVNSFAALDHAASPFDAFDSFPQSALGYAEATKAPALKAASAVYADGSAVWAKGFGGQRVQDSSGAFIGGTTTGAGGAVGYERMIDPDLKVGALVGGSTNKTNLYLNAGSTNTDTVFGGAYGRKMWGATFLDLAVIGGNLANTNVRNIGGGLGLASANASYGGWFIDPSLAFGHRFDVDLHGNFTITPAVKVRYLDAHFDGYAESGAGVADLTVAGRDFQAWEERAELTFANTFAVGGGQRVTVRVTGGALAQQRSAGGQVNIALVGQNFLAATPDRGSVTGAFGGAGLDWQMGNVTLFASGEATGTNDSTHTYAAKGGARMSW